MKAVNPNTTLGQLIEENPERARLFAARRIDYCCGGDKTLAQACEKRGLDIDQIIDELGELDRRSTPGDQPSFETASELIDFIVDKHHRYLREELAPLSQLVNKVARVHGRAHPELEQIAETYYALARELLEHVDQEEDVVFPALVELDEQAASANADQVLRLLADLDDDHDQAGRQLEQIRELTDDFDIPQGACASYRNMLARPEQDTHMHVHRENNLLFPRVREQIA